MNAEEWFKDQLEKFKNDIDFKTEGIILELTEKIVEIMDRNKVNRAELANRLGVSNAYITKLLNGNPNLTIKSLVSIASALNCDLEISFPCQVEDFQNYKKTEIKNVVIQSPEENAAAA